jgi:rhodanese-related sulfurtransferase
MRVNIGFQDLVRRAEAEIETIDVTEAMTAAGEENTVFIDLRDIRELQREGKIPGAKHIPRGMLEFWIDPQSPYHKPLLAEPKRFIFYCNLGWRSALATQVAQQMGVANLCHIKGGFEAWKKAGGAVEELAQK